MGETFSTSLKNIQDLDWHDLAELFIKYPFSQKITGLMSIKAQMENSINMDNPGQKSFLLSNNPGIQYANLVRDVENLSELVNSNELKTIAEDEWTATPEHPQTFVSETPNPVDQKSDPDSRKPSSSKKIISKNKPAPSGYQSDFTKWLLGRSSGKPKAEAQAQDKKAEDLTIKISDSNQLREEIVSEPLAALYAKQGLIKEAIEMYTKLSLKIPDKSTYFAEIIKKLKKSN